jgi:hypothetical protein
MGFDALVATRFRASVEGCVSSIEEEHARRGDDGWTREVTTRLMMGGECVMVSGNMVGGVCSDKRGGNIMLRVGKHQHDDAMCIPGIVECTYFPNKPSFGGGFVYIDVAGMGLAAKDVDEATTRALDEMTMLAVDHAASLPVKSQGDKRKRAPSKPSKPSKQSKQSGGEETRVSKANPAKRRRR